MDQLGLDVVKLGLMVEWCILIHDLMLANVQVPFDLFKAGH